MKEIPLTQGKVALVDDEDFERLNKYKWRVHHTRGLYYAQRAEITGSRNKGKSVFMHRDILKLTDPKIIADHIDHDGLNNQKSNLRTCTHAQNQQNSKKHKGLSRFKGVTYSKRDRRWIANIRVDGINKCLGYFVIEEDAAKAYADAAKKHFGMFACLDSISA